MDKNPCRCIFKHANSSSERMLAVKKMQEANRAGDTTGVVLALASMGPCKSIPVKVVREKR